MSFSFDDFLAFTFPPSAALLGGLAITIYAAITAQLIGVALGILAALGGRSRNPILGTVSGFYVWIFRGTPVLVQEASGSQVKGSRLEWRRATESLVVFGADGAPSETIYHPPAPGTAPGATPRATPPTAR